jgi:hypothetical protein
MVYLAGVPLTGGADPTLDLATLPLWPGTQARVFRSFAPAALGRGSLGGTLVLDPPSPRAKAQTEVWGAIGSFGQRRVRVGDVRGDPEGVRVASGFSASRSDDDFSYLDPVASAAGPDVFRARENAGHAAANGLVSVALPVRVGQKRGALTSTVLVQGRRQDLPGPVLQPTRFQSLRSSRLVSAVELTLPAGEGTFGVRGWGRREGLAIRDRPEDALFFPSETSDAIIAAGGSARYKLPNLEVRVDGSAERFAPGSWIGALQPPASRRTNAGIAADASTRFGDVTLAASARGDAWVDASEDGPSRSFFRPTTHGGGELALGSFAIATHAGYTARPPSFVELYGNRGGFLGEASLRPESAVTVDLGGRWSTGRRRAKLELEGAVFGTWAEDLITFVAQGAFGRAKATNIGRARILGLEQTARGTIADFSLRVSHTALATANASECLVVAGGCERPPLPGRPSHDLVADLTWERGIVRLRYGVDLVAGMRSDLRGRSLVPDRLLHGAGARVRIPGVPGLSITVDVRNLFDLRAGAVPDVGGSLRVPIGDLFEYPLPGRRFLLSARWAFPGER